jgi:hypothetical protein
MQGEGDTGGETPNNLFLNSFFKLGELVPRKLVYYFLFKKIGLLVPV